MMVLIGRLAASLRHPRAWSAKRLQPHQSYNDLQGLMLMKVMMTVMRQMQPVTVSPDGVPEAARTQDRIAMSPNAIDR
jgi:hypothetical protein